MNIVVVKTTEGIYSVIAHSIRKAGKWTWKLIKLDLIGELKYSTKRRACLALVHKLQPMKGTCALGFTYIVPKLNFKNLTEVRKWCREQNGKEKQND